MKDPDDQQADRQRLDKWLVFARIVKTRTLAADLVENGHVRIDGRRIDLPGKGIRIGDVLTIALERDVVILRVLGFAARRGPAREAQALYERLDAPAPR